MSDAADHVNDIDSFLTTGQDVDMTDTAYKTQYKKMPSHIKQFFDMLDTDKNGVLDREEVMQGAMKVGMTGEQTKKFFDLLDTNKDGVLSLEEFSRGKIDKKFMDAYLLKATPKAENLKPFFLEGGEPPASNNTKTIAAD